MTKPSTAYAMFGLASLVSIWFVGPWGLLPAVWFRSCSVGAGDE